MPLKIQPTNRPKIGLDGYCKGTITKVELLEESEELKAPSFKWTTEHEGILRPMSRPFYTPASYNVDLENHEVNEDEEPTLFEQFSEPRLSILANILVQLGLLTNDVINKLRNGDVNIEEVEIDPETIYGVPLKFKFFRRNGQYLINRSTIERLRE